MVNWRKWILDNLVASTDLTDLIPADRIYGGGSVASAKSEKPFIVITLSDEVPTVADAVQFVGSIWIHDEPGDYGLIGDCLKLVRDALPYQVTETGGLVCSWLGNSGDLANDLYKTITRNAQFNLLGREI